MSRAYTIGTEYRDAGMNYEQAADDEFHSWLREPVPENETSFIPMKAMKPLRNYSDNETIGKYAAFILVSNEADPVYPDVIDLSTGTIKYWGDAKRQTLEETVNVEDFYGNRNLAPEREKLVTGQFDRITPILFFKKERPGYVRFLGLCVLETVTRDVYKQEIDGQYIWTPNFLFHLVVLDVESVPLRWIHSRAASGTDEYAPDIWERWKLTGEVSEEMRYTSSADGQFDDGPVAGETEGPSEEIATATPSTVSEAFAEGATADTNVGSTAGRISQYQARQVRVSQSFRNRVFDLYNEQCVLTQIHGSPLVTLSHIVPRSEAIEYAEDITNVFLLNWTHHVAFDRGLFTIDPNLRLSVNPDFETEDPHLQRTIIDRHQKTINLPEGVELSAERIEERNEVLSWWPVKD